MSDPISTACDCSGGPSPVPATGNVREWPGLSPREHCLASVANLVALRRTGELPLQLDKALESGFSREELFEAIARGVFSRRALTDPADGAPDSP